MQMITYRLHDSLPNEVLAKLCEEFKHASPGHQEKQRFSRLDEYLDKGIGSCFLADEAIAQLVEQNLLHFNQTRYKLHAWVIMPNHVHVLLSPKRGESLSRILGSRTLPVALMQFLDVNAQNFGNENTLIGRSEMKLTFSIQSTTFTTIH